MLVDAFNKENTNAGRSVDVLVYAKDDIFDFKWDLETRVIPQIDFHITLIQDGLDETLPGQAENDKITIYEKQ